ncbi:DapH/DapD/GlmU-related protein [Erythrobacter sp. HL-111]|uniref:acyltransferase n=1 Tax=Erythrobacter sp. HL-111 TaxID=1798193 RepID=UPI0006DB11E6|nr:acyltransferase [Erythrobacter sp. HL-111]KPP95476.1 MAG: Bacterial transferase hexapeptide (six repeats) [Erythrobacteraceae bacterium HL-111]SDS72357.1 Hexapeptide repeat of succinyl-transferase [Erythrobacter sp. HL-111]
MLHFRIRDALSILFYRLLAPFFGSFGRGVRIVRPLRIWGARHCHFGDEAVVQCGAYLVALAEHDAPPVLKVGARTMIGHHAHIVATRRVEFGQGVLTADRIFVADNRHAFDDPAVPVRDQGLVQLAEVTIGDGSWLGENVCILGASVGRNCVIAANSVVTRDIPDRCIAAGSPARVVKRYCEERGGWYPTDETGEFA